MRVRGVQSLEGVTTDAVLTRLYDYWLQRRGAKQFPSRNDIDPVDFRFALGRVSLIDVLDRPRRFRYRLVGTMVTEHLGYEMTGKFLDELPDSEVRAYLEQLYAQAVEDRAPLYEGDRVVLDGRLWKHETLVLPLSTDDRSVDMLMIYRATERPQPLPAPPPGSR